MKNLKSIIMLAVMAVLAVTFNSCQKEEFSPIENGNEATGQSLMLKSGIDVSYLEDLITRIETLVSEGTLSEGTGNSLIAKVENAIRSIQNGNSNAVKGQLNALINQVEGLIDRGVLTPEQGQPLIDGAESELILEDGYFIDPRDGEKYTVVQIGTQMWMAENLRATKYNAENDVPNVTDIGEWMKLNTGAFCWYENNPSNKYPNGALYNWYAINQETNGGNNLCPAGWHVSTDEDWIQLELFIGFAEDRVRETVNRPSPVPGALLLKSTYGWQNVNGNNSTGFSALPGGFIYSLNGQEGGVGYFSELGINGWWWTATESNTNCAYQRIMYSIYPYHILRINTNYKTNGFSVRCVKN